MRRISTSALCILFFLRALSTLANDARVEESLPISGGLITVLDTEGNSIAPTPQRKLEFSAVIVNRLIGFRPKSAEDAACELTRMFPGDFYARLVAGRSDVAKLGSVPSDPAISERVFDVAVYLDEIWGATLANGKDPMTRLARLLELSTKCSQGQQ